jgi:hypothetical protein
VTLSQEWVLATQIVATLFGAAYVVLAARRNTGCAGCSAR